MVGMVLLHHIGALAHAEDGLISRALAVHQLFNFLFFTLCFELALFFFLQLVLPLFLFSSGLFLLLLPILLLLLLLLLQPILLNLIHGPVEIEVLCLQEFDGLVLLEVKHRDEAIDHIPFVYVEGILPLERSRS